MKEYDVNIGVLTVPINIAQEITDKMVDGGIKAVWNFTPFPNPCTREYSGAEYVSYMLIWLLCLTD